MLRSMQKKQNTRRVLAQSIYKIYRAGMMVTAGFIIGFDTENGQCRRTNDRLGAIEDTAIPVCMVGLLYALPNTQLTQRLKAANRVFPEGLVVQSQREGQGDQCTTGLNFQTLRPRREILADFRAVIDKVYAPQAYFNRVLRVANELDRYWPRSDKADKKVRRIGGIPNARPHGAPSPGDPDDGAATASAAIFPADFRALRQK